MANYGRLYRFWVMIKYYPILMLEIAQNTINNISLYKYRKYASLPKSLSGKMVLITGANSGIGFQTTKAVVARDAQVIMACRNYEKAQQAIDAIVKDIGDESKRNNISVVLMNLSDLKSVRSAAEQINGQISHLDVLINNAGVMMTPEMKTTDGHEYQLGVNHLGHFLLTNLLLDKLKAAPSGARIVNVSSQLFCFGNMHFENFNLKGIYSSFWAYCRSKLANVLFSGALAKRMRGSEVHIYALHPGIIHTQPSSSRVYNLFAGSFSITAKEGAQTSLYCGFDSRVSKENCSIETSLPTHATDDAEIEKLWKLSLQLCGLDDKFTSTSVEVPAIRNNKVSAI